MDGSLWKQADNVLCIRLDNMGDVLMTTPAIRALKYARPGRRITLLASVSGAALSPFLPDVDDVIAYDAPWMKNDGGSAEADSQLIDRLRQMDFDAAVIFTVYSQSPLPAALICWQAGIDLVAAYCRENPYALLTDWQRETEPGCQIRHEVQRQLDLVDHLAAPCVDPRLVFAPRASDRDHLYKKLSGTGIGRDTLWIVAHCGATAPSRRYPAEHFAEALRQLGGHLKAVVLTGSTAEVPLLRHIRRLSEEDIAVVNLAGVLTLGELACLIEDAALLLSNNTGPVHLAAALQTPVVDLYALTNPQHTPWMVANRVLFHDVQCKYCYRSVCPEKHHDCLRKVSPEMVSAAVLDLLAETGHLPSQDSTITAKTGALPC